MRSDELDPYVVKVDRRLFLRGTGGALLALPTLPSLFSASEAQAADPVPKCFVHFRTAHGGVMEPNMYPPDNTLTESMTYLHTIRRGALQGSTANGVTTLSPVLSGPSTILTPALVAKMNVLRGLDLPIDLIHNANGCMGYFARDGREPTEPRATIDQLIAYSPAVYPSIASVKRRSLVIGSPAMNSQIVGFNTPGVRSSGVSGNSIQPTQSSRGLYDTLLGGSTTTPTARTPIVDRVLDNYKRLRNGTKRLPAEDKLRLDQHINSVAELQRRLNTQVSTGCVIPPRPSIDSSTIAGNPENKAMDGDPAKNVQFFQLINEVVAVAMNCGATRVAAYTVNEDFLGCTFTTWTGWAWHNDIAHNCGTLDGQGQDYVKRSNQTFFQGVYLDLISRLNSFGDGYGGTLLDHSLVAWGQEHGHQAHEVVSMPVITAGSAGGALKTGNYCDYRNLNRPKRYGESQLMHPGLIYNQWMTNALMAMGVPQADWVETTHPGYGPRQGYVNDWIGSATCYPEAMWQKTAEKLPYL